MKTPSKAKPKVTPFSVFDENGKFLRGGRAKDKEDAEKQAVNPGETVQLVETKMPRRQSVITKAHVKHHAARLLRHTDFYAIRLIEVPSKKIPDDIADYRAAVRAASEVLEGMDPIPSDYQHPKWWPDVP